MSEVIHIAFVSISTIGLMLALVSVIWSYILIYRHGSLTSFILAWFLWGVVYPVFVFRHWAVAKVNFYSILSGIALSMLIFV